MTKNDFTNTILEFNAGFSSNVQAYSDTNYKPSLAISHENGEIDYIPLGFCANVSYRELNIPWDGEVVLNLGETWIKWMSVNITWSAEHQNGICKEFVDFNVNYEADIVNWLNHNILIEANVQIKFEFSDFAHNSNSNDYVIDFNNLYRPVDELGNTKYVKIDVSAVESVKFPLIPTNYAEPRANLSAIINSNEEIYYVIFSKIKVTNGLNYEKVEKEATDYSIAEDYDTVFNYCPRRIAR